MEGREEREKQKERQRHKETETQEGHTTGFPKTH